MSYEKQGFTNGQVLHAEQLAKMEDGIRNVNWDDVAAYEGVLFEATIEKSQLFIGDSTADASFQPTPLISGETYNVHFNGVDYKNLTCKESDNCLYIGNEQLLIPWGTLSSEPFVVCYYSKDRYSAIRIDNLELESFDFSLEGKSYVLIPDKYTPLGDWVQRGSEYCSIMIGEENTASGRYSYAEGFYNTASGDYSHAENTNTIASGEAAHAEGSGTEAEGGSSHAEGENASASGRGAHAEGWHTIASGEYSHAEGAYAIASGGGAHAEGGYDAYAPMFEMQTVASGNGSHAEGFNTTASGDYSHSEGLTTTASGYKSHAEGDHTIASTENQHVQGSYNIEDTEHKYLHIIGNGTAFNKRSNAHTVDHKGNAWYAGDVESNAMIVRSSSEGSSKRFRITVNDDGVISAEEVLAPA